MGGVFNSPSPPCDFPGLGPRRKRVPPFSPDTRVAVLRDSVVAGSEKSASFCFYVSLECVHEGETPMCTPAHPWGEGMNAYGCLAFAVRRTLT